jgi:polar amino acid transport system substrate-binding protein
MKLAEIALAALIGAVVALGLARVGAGPVPMATQSPKETVYQRVMRTGTLRCGYFLWPRVFERDPNTGAFSGLYHDVVEEVGRQLSLKIDWTEEFAFASAFDGLKMGRYDAICAPLTATPGRARETAFTVPILYGPDFLYARADDARFDNDYAKVNDPAVRVAVLEGEMSQTIKNEDFPKAQTISMPDVTDITQVLLQVAMGKADVALTEPSTAEQFLRGNPGKLKRVPGPPVRVEMTGLNVGVGEEALKDLLNTTITTLHSTGFIERVIEKYRLTPEEFFYPAQPWRAPEAPAVPNGDKNP